VPKVSEEHRAARRDQILRAAARCVAKEGFHRTTMADVIATAGLSAGAVYGYFPSKRDLIRTLAEEALDAAAQRLTELTTREGPVDLRQTIDELIDAATGTYGADSPNIAVQVWAEAGRDADVAATAALHFDRLRAALAGVVARCQADGTVPAHADPEACALVLIGVLEGLVVQQVIDPDLDRTRYVDGLFDLMGN
jgi:AcrR family transcriptional regulator